MKIRMIYFIFFISFLMINLAYGKNRTALVIGNSSYNFDPLKNPVNDAKDISKVLRELNFKVICVTNGSKKQILNAAKELQLELYQNRGVGMLYYAGHAVQISDENYIIPVDIELKNTLSLTQGTIKMQSLLKMFATTGNDKNIVVIDACRDNPFYGYSKVNSDIISRSARKGVNVVQSNGLATIDARSGTFIAYATSPNMVALDGTGRNGVYTKYLLKYIRTEGQTIEELFKKVRVSVQRETNGAQIPWERSSLLDEFYFIKGKNIGGKRRIFGAF